MMFFEKSEKMDMHVIYLANSDLHPSAKGAFADVFLFDFKAIKR